MSLDDIPTPPVTARGHPRTIARRRHPGVDRDSGRRIVRFHLGMFAALTAVVAVAPTVIHHPNAPARARVVFDPLLGGWLRWDGWWYIAVARHGYTYQPHRMSSVAFFPVYPILVRGAGALLPGGPNLAAIATTVVSGAAALTLLYRWTARRMSSRAARSAVTAIALYPFAWFLYGAAYTDALYLTLVIAAFLLLEDDRLWWAAAIGALATATRPTGITLTIGLVAVAMDRLGDDRLRIRRIVTALSSLTGLVIWCGWLAGRFGNPLAFIETEGAPGWNQPPGIRTWFKLDLLTKLGRLPAPEIIAIVLQIAMMILFVAMVPMVRRRFGRGYAVYTLAAIALPVVSTGDFLGVGRYLLAAFPVFAAAGVTMESVPARRVRLIAATSTTLLVAGTALFSAGYLVS